MKRLVLSTVVLIFGMNCFSNNVIPNKKLLASFQDYQQDSKIGYIEHRGRR